MSSLILIAALLFTVGVVMMAIANNGGPGTFGKVAWVLWAVAAILWFAVTFGEQNISLFREG